MMAFFPIPHEDELLYSILARYRVYSGNVSLKSTLDDIYGHRNVTAVMDLPSNINRIIANMPLGNQYDANELIQKYTLYPFYAAFIPPKRANEIKDYMKEDKGGSIYNKIGLMASSIRLNEYFKFCPECVKEDQERFGELYWHRIHQISGVFVCPKHKVLLQDSKIPVRGFNKHEYVAATVNNCNNSRGITNITDDMHQKLNLIAQDIEALLNTEHENKEIEWFIDQYANILMEKGLANINRKIKQKELLTSFVNYYGDKLLILLQSYIDIHSDQNWLSDLVRRKNKTSHPIRHLLFIRFLGITIDDLFNKKIEYKPFGDGPWPCLNVASTHYLKDAIVDVNIKHNADSKKPLGTFRCSCGFIYSRTGPDIENDDRYKISKIKVYGPIWEEKLKELAEKRLSLRETARQLNADPATIKKYVDKLDIRTYWENRTVENIKDDKVRDITMIEENNLQLKQNEWLSLKKKYPSKSRTELRKLNPALYSWLYRNCKEWMEKNSPIKQEPSSVTSRINWQERDNEILLRVTEVVEEIMNSEEKPERITISLIGSKLGIRSLIEKHLSKLSRTKKCLEENIESTKDFQIRRIEWAIKELKLQGKELKPWKIYRMAGIRIEHYEELKEVMDILVNNAENDYL
ncbi:mRNA-degrading endonuclease HigB of HigAB toxin-antitoxin module [Clostridium tetanomorphum]|uniref:TnsD family Tn7-like transposition protein n=1 Tax=Clostridium tetanomorphum TaxID=1553 RepID=UPI000551F41F|nr:TnsD family Tn7-like transposition protein [Clostridium tetanomorphum]MBP1863665.1 mRNA-degrading endonuclease HigB of HigAB toxin-antitoxin module [Clostridium tetanomorphum]NRS86241.1 mRNA-degrading endonuclease HigB of HigAB toxin-antitoxin module [Clostridium tetanomorphum]